ncbi:hypothetical protein TRAPUB_5469 [Trametes pubescens]|uniref:BTB domain-containing protein n=1 Tax=Trametes pubescens TaxID=154538 RepID=A0A1M2V8J7_TRAPU|nr:hypothetical protein TRAPUB_5469 [Trametes pubescens]
MTRRSRALFEDSKDEDEKCYQEMFASGKLGKSLDDHFKQDSCWYPDGNIIRRVNDTLFKLHHSRLVRYCECFPPELTRPLESSALWEVIDGCPVFTISALSVKDLEVFLTQLAMNPPSQSVTGAILRTAHVLKSPLFTTIGTRALESLWPSQYSPDTHTTRRPWTDTLDAITLAHEHHLPQLVKPAFSTLLRSYTFWDALKHSRTRIPLPETDILRLYEARRAMGRAWRLLVLAPPLAECCAPERAVASGMACKVLGTARAGEWCAFWIERRYVEQGAHDPWRGVDVMKLVCADLRATWCWWCLEERARAWDAALLEWWNQLDDWLGIKCPP